MKNSFASTYNIISTEKPKYYQLRWKLSNFIIHIAKIIYPENPEIKAFFLKIIMDYMILGESIIRINPENFTIEKK